MNWFYKLRMAYKILLPVSITLVLVLGIMAWQIQSKGSEVVQKIAERELKALGNIYSSTIHKFIDLALNASIENASTISYLEENGQGLERKQIISLLIKALNANNVAAAGIALLPTADDAQYINTQGSDEQGQFHPYATPAGLILLDKSEYNAKHFTVPQSTRKPYFSAPYYYTIEGRKELITTASAPIIVNNVFKGVVLFDIKLDLLNDMAEDIQVYKTGGITILTQDGVIMAHRNKDLVFENMFTLDRWRNNADAKDAINSSKSYMTTALVENVDYFFYFHPFKFTQTDQIMYLTVMVPVEEVLADVAQITNITLLASIFALIILLLVIFIGVRSSVKPLALIAASADAVANGNYNVQIDTRTLGGEVLNLHRSLERMLNSLVENISNAEILSKDAQEQTLKAQEATHEAELARVEAEGAKRQGMLDAASQLESVVSIVSVASEHLLAQVNQSELASIRQAERIDETATAMEEMNATVLEVAQNASLASKISTNARACAESGTTIVKSAVTGITSVQSVSLALKEDMNTLAEKAKSISEIMNVISDIADQTNLLALNAAIEAARAGEAGRGFAVVADEVRKLAEKTMSSTTAVGNAIQSIQKSVDASIVQVDKAVELIAVATKQSNQSGESLNEIMSLVDSTADQINSIATASEEQSATSEEINRAIMEINDISRQSAESMREASSAVNDLTTQTHTLSKLIEEMKQG